MAEPVRDLLTYLELHPEHRNARYTLRGLFSRRQTAKTKAKDLLESGLDVYAYEEDAPNGSKIYAVAARQIMVPTSRTGLPHTHSADWEITRAAVDLFRRIMRTSKGSRAYRWYKPLDVELLHRRIRGLSWTGSHVDVAARIISDIVLAHPLPNANHRTSIHLARSYLQACGITWPRYNLRGRGAQRLHRETKGFFIQSKYLLQLYRHPEMILKAHDVGYHYLRIGPGADARIQPQDLRLSKNDLKARHLAGSRKLVRDLARGNDLQKLETTRTKKLREWAQTIRG